MNQFEEFSLIFFALDSVWQKTPDENLGQFLSDCNPFLWKNIDSADPAMLSEFCEMCPQKEISLEDSYKIASEYITGLPYYYSDAVRRAWLSIPEEIWLEAAKKYLSQPHKK